MHFHITLMSDETYGADFSYGVVFLPTAVFVEKGEHLLIPNPDTPKYELGFFAKFIEVRPELLTLKNNKRAHILIEDVGHGTEEDLDVLVSDLEQNHFSVLQTKI